MKSQFHTLNARRAGNIEHRILPRRKIPRIERASFSRSSCLLLDRKDSGMEPGTPSLATSGSCSSRRQMAPTHSDTPRGHTPSRQCSASKPPNTITFVHIAAPRNQKFIDTGSASRCDRSAATDTNRAARATIKVTIVPKIMAIFVQS